MSKTADFRENTYTPKEFYDYQMQIEKAMAADIVLACEPATLGTSAAVIAVAVAAGEVYEVDVVVTLKDAAGNLHTWFNKDLTAAVVATTIGDGTAIIKDSATVVEVRNGTGTITLQYDDTWAATDDATLTITGGTFVGVATGNKTFVDTVVA